MERPIPHDPSEVQTILRVTYGSLLRHASSFSQKAKPHLRLSLLKSLTHFVYSTTLPLTRPAVSQALHHGSSPHSGSKNPYITIDVFEDVFKDVTAEELARLIFFAKHFASARPKKTPGKENEIRQPLAPLITEIENGAKDEPLTPQDVFFNVRTPNIKSSRYDPGASVVDERFVNVREKVRWLVDGAN
ncbi:hypothetical protein TL16_g07268 [Triparma laevis f. inornata]|uniref:Uncharacterized protein n=2 Tax=Triparma laevis TaxID=1534972 RepID=A0A9W7FAB9_9STRA|nr:hypothetical protein TL16_g07268 [Triparma laevis f. inornata]GMI06694.1 hypothetical protein TrLO_g614 [Triparma laevis f. longispina]